MLQQARGSVSGSEDESENEDEWEGFDEPVPVDHEAEYIDEDKYTTVTVEEMGTTRDDLQQDNKEYSLTGNTGDSKTSSTSRSEKGDQPAKRRQKAAGEKKRKKKFRYESKEERKITQRKERMSNRRHKKARQED